LQLRAGHFQTFSFLLDMNDLFERFVAGFLRRHRVQSLPPSLQDCEILTQGKGVTRWLAQTQPNGGRPVFRLKPDILFRQRGSQRVPLIVDTKYKTHDRVKESDAYQMLAYATRYQCNELLLLYPQARMQAQTLYIETAATEEESICLRTQTTDLSHDLSTKSGRDCLTQELHDALKGG
jgi:5-methylcytosine-specific restriction enzyme subunit McrC